jgi:catechol 2,3-dioxygenase-like lactoylglutathione lyase family enzyme
MNSTTESMQQGPILSGAEPILYVADFAASLAFFTEKLGFAVDFAYGDPPFYGVVVRDRARLCLRLVHEPVFVGDIRQREELLSASRSRRFSSTIRRPASRSTKRSGRSPGGRGPSSSSIRTAT